MKEGISALSLKPGFSPSGIPASKQLRCFFDGSPRRPQTGYELDEGWHPRCGYWPLVFTSSPVTSHWKEPYKRLICAHKRMPLASFTNTPEEECIRKKNPGSPWFKSIWEFSFCLVFNNTISVTFIWNPHDVCYTLMLFNDHRMAGSQCPSDLKGVLCPVAVLAEVILHRRIGRDR